ncbi:CDP-diacylglycerol--glycerol-3-phosphate 3-phosphatidyltransferase [Jiangella rhizosphaerae]|uniref:CDP-diacylglycerol--glycerol-3-phosphate 3-phosphatidyltransferase n=1 Tax=Jiangella rhizosphaerae TaxID=2293569 RepID=A0A418KW12_9ACTN|nr:CDP-diacylglycerol--glycerol-3-phosphate 3-phosphatidyltransferase [Jiangella rhizosphaerae]RIQ34829.1 CDP-diacylglycerol--glycerol-3-phosphate 3-phosphatidyltransferase [Jiangella rhizosphaerae]
MAEPSTVPPSAWNIANALTILRVVLVPLFGWLLLREGGDHDPSRVAAFFAFGVAMMTDRLDGDIARRRGLVTDFGKIADPIADKALTGMAFVGLSLLGELPWWVTVVVLVREWGITVLRFAVIRYGVMAANRGGKLKTVLQALALGLYILPLPGWFDPVEASVMAVAVIVTVVTGVDYVLSAIRLRRSATP